MNTTSTINGIQLTALDPATFRRTPWKNGGGVTINIAETMLPGFAPGGWDGMVWRFGRTAIVTPGPFSDLGGLDRLQMLVCGHGLVLETPAGEIDVRQPFQPVRFAGETRIVSRLEAGPVEVVNLLGDRSRVAINLASLATGATHACPAGVHIIYAAQTACELTIHGTACAIASGHALRIDAAGHCMVAGRLGTAVIASALATTRMPP